MAKNPTQITRAWAAVTIRKFRQNLRSQGIGSSQNLARSFQAFVEGEAGGDLVKVKMAYALAGMFVDMGVGRGQRLGQKRVASRDKTGRFLAGKKRRLPKMWYSKTMRREAFILAQILQAHTGQRLVAHVSESLPKQVEVNL